MAAAPKKPTKAEPEAIRRMTFVIARDAIASNNPLAYRDALDRIARLAAFGPKKGDDRR